VVDATRIERNLNLVLQVLEITDRAVLCVNLIDEAKRNKIEINDRQLSRSLGIPVIPTAARQGVGIPELLKSIHDVATGGFVCKPYKVEKYTPKLNEAIEKLTAKVLSSFPALPNARWVALRLLEGDQRIIDAVKNREFESLIK